MVFGIGFGFATTFGWLLLMFIVFFVFPLSPSTPVAFTLVVIDVGVNAWNDGLIYFDGVDIFILRLKSTLIVAGNDWC